MTRKKKKAFTLDMATARGTLDFAVKDPEGRVFAFGVKEPNDVQRQKMLERLQKCKSDAESNELLADWLFKASTDGAERGDILAMLNNPASAPEQKSMLMTIVLTGRQPDPKLHGQLVQKLADNLLKNLVAKL